MINNFGATPMQGMQQMQRPSAPPPPPSDEMISQGIERLEENIGSGEIDASELDAKLADRFGEAGADIVSDSGEVDYDALKDLMVSERNDKMQEHLGERFGEEAASAVFNTDGSINGEALESLFSASGASGDMPPPPPPGGQGGPQQAGGGESDQSGMLMQLLDQSGKASSYGASGEKQTASIFGQPQPLIDLFV